MADIINLQDWLTENKEKETKALYLTANEIRVVPGFENISDEEVINVINTLHQLSLITYSTVTNELNTEMRKQEVA